MVNIPKAENLHLPHPETEREKMMLALKTALAVVVARGAYQYFNKHYKGYMHIHPGKILGYEFGKMNEEGRVVAQVSGEFSVPEGDISRIKEAEISSVEVQGDVKPSDIDETITDESDDTNEP